MTADLLFASVAADERLADEVTGVLEQAGLGVEQRHDMAGPLPEVRLAVVLVTRRSSGTPELNAMIDTLAAAGLKTILAWWDEDAPSDFLSEHAAEEEVFYACFLPRPHRAPALVERVRAELAEG